jgi:hypothetical protein
MLFIKKFLHLYGVLQRWDFVNCYEPKGKVHLALNIRYFLSNLERIQSFMEYKDFASGFKTRQYFSKKWRV